MSFFEPIVKSINFIENNLKEEITIKDIAASAHYSIFHFIRVFNRYVRMTPYDYLIRRRLSRAAEEILLSHDKIISVAFDYQFNTHETFSRSFKKMFGMQPALWRKNGNTNNRYSMPLLTDKHLQHFQRCNYFPPEIIENKGLELVGLMAPCNKLGNNQSLHSSLRNIVSSKNPNPDYYGLLMHSDFVNDDPFFMSAVNRDNIDYSDTIAVEKTIKATTFVQFVHIGNEKSLNLTLDYIHHIWLKKSGCLIKLPFEIFHYNCPPNEPGDNSAIRVMLSIKK